METISKLSHLSSSFCCNVGIAMYSKCPKETILFYKTLGFFFDQNRLSPPILKIISSQEPNTGIHVEVESANGLVESHIQDYDQRIIEFIPTLPIDFNKPPAPLTHRWVTILRTHQLEKTKEFYQFLGRWQWEKHGKGPVHYSNQLGGVIFEIYPYRKKYEANIEFIVTIDAFSKRIESLKRLNLSFLEETEKSVLCRDPDFRLVQILKGES